MTTKQKFKEVIIELLQEDNLWKVWCVYLNDIQDEDLPSNTQKAFSLIREAINERIETEIRAAKPPKGITQSEVRKLMIAGVENDWLFMPLKNINAKKIKTELFLIYDKLT